MAAARLSTATPHAESDHSTKIATTAYVVDKITTLIGGAPSTLNDLNELAAAINDDADYNSTLTTALATKLPLAGGTMTGNIAHADNAKAKFGTGNDLQIFHDSSHSFITESGTGNLRVGGDNLALQSSAHDENYVICLNGDSVTLYHNNAAKISTTATGVSITGTVVATTTTDASNTGNVTLDFAANQNFVLTLQGATTLVNPSTETVGQSGFITFIQDGTGGRTVALGTDYETAGAAGITLSTAASATDIVPYVVVAANRILLGTPQLAFA